MPSQKNINTVEKLTDKFKNSSALYFAKYTGVNVEQAAKLRMKFIDNDVDFLVSKNTLSKIAAKNAGYDDLFDNILSGQIAIAYANSDPTSPARVIKEFSKDNESFEVVGLYFEGNLYDPSKYKELANLPTKDVLLTKFIYCLNSPMSNTVLLLSASMTKLVGTLKSLENQKK
jgi:large subunit ribosomal protein L10